jgi:hypothetical protein
LTFIGSFPEKFPSMMLAVYQDRNATVQYTPVLCHTMAGYQTVKKTFRVQSHNKPTEQTIGGIRKRLISPKIFGTISLLIANFNGSCSFYTTFVIF